MLQCRVKTVTKASESVFIALALQAEGELSGTRVTLNQGAFTVLPRSTNKHSKRGITSVIVNIT